MDGTVDCWRNSDGDNVSLSNAPGETDVGYHSVTLDTVKACGLRKDKQIRCWSYFGELRLNLSYDSPWRNNSHLLDIDIEGASLSPSFVSNVYNYTATVPNATTSVAVKPELTNAMALSYVYSDTGGAAGDGGIVPLAEGETEIRIRVISADRSSYSEYTITLTK